MAFTICRYTDCRRLSQYVDIPTADGCRNLDTDGSNVKALCMESSIILQRCNTYRFTGTYYCLHFIIHCCSTESQGNQVHPTVVCNIRIMSLCKFTRIRFLTLTRTLGQLSYPNEDVRVRKRIRVNLYC